MMDIKEIRAALEEKFGARKYRIARDGGISVFGVIPNKDVTGWWLFGFLHETQVEMKLRGMESKTPPPKP